MKKMTDFGGAVAFGLGDVVWRRRIVSSWPLGVAPVYCAADTAGGQVDAGRHIDGRFRFYGEGLKVQKERQHWDRPGNLS
jgi:hypothetical protein